MIMLQRVSSTHLDTGLSRPSQKERGRVEAPKTQARVLAVREATGALSLPPAPSTSSLRLLSPLSTLLQPHRSLWWSSNLPRTTLLQGLCTCPFTIWNALLCILASCPPLSQDLLKCHILRKASDYPVSACLCPHCYPNSALFFFTMRQTKYLFMDKHWCVTLNKLPPFLSSSFYWTGSFRKVNPFVDNAF